MNTSKEHLSIYGAFYKALKTIPNFQSEIFLLAISGGVDSMVLLHLFKQASLRFQVAHVNFQLRGEDSNLDEKLVKEVCDTENIVCHVNKVDTASFCNQNKMGVQEAARVIRYNWFKEIQSELNSNFLVTAHHLNDNIETFFINAKRGSGLRGLKSMSNLDASGSIFRPLLELTKTQIRDYASSNMISYREDVSNEKNDYLRNAIRNEIMPIFSKIDAQYEQKFGVTLLNLQNDFDFLLHQLESESKKVMVNYEDLIEIKNFRTLHSRLILHCIEKFGFSRNDVQSILQTQESSKEFFSTTYKLLIDRNRLIISSKKEIQSPRNEIVVDGLGTYSISENILINFSEVSVSSTIEKSTEIAFVDFDNINFPLTIRNWQPGDKFIPFGMQGQKKVSDFLTDLKLSKWEKEKIQVLLSNDKIVWVIGIRIADTYKIQKNSKKILKIETYTA